MADKKTSADAIDLILARASKQQNVGYDPTQEQQVNEFYAQDQQRLDQALQQDKEGFLLTNENLETSNPFISLPTNALNIFGRTVASVAHNGLALGATYYTTSARDIERDLPNDIKAANTRIQLARNGQARIAQEIDAIRKQVSLGTIDPDTALREMQRKQAESDRMAVDPADVAKLQQRAPALVYRHGTGEIRTYQDAVNKVNDLRATAKEVVGDRERGVSDILHTDALWNSNASKEIMGGIQDKVHEYAQNNPNASNWDKIKHATSEATHTITNNPAELLGTTAESLANVLSKRMLVMGTAGETANFAITQRDRFNEQNDRQNTSMTDGEELATDLAVGAYGALNFVGDSILHGATRLVSPVARTAVTGATAGSTATQASAGLLQRVGQQIPDWAKTAVVNPVTANTARISGAMGQEYVTEGLQSVLEDSYGHLDNRFDVQKFAVGGTIGALAAGVMTAPTSTVRMANDLVNKEATPFDPIESADITSSRFDPISVMANSYSNAERTAEGIKEVRESNKQLLTDMVSNIQEMETQQQEWQQVAPRKKQIEASITQLTEDILINELADDTATVTQLTTQREQLASELQSLNELKDPKLTKTIEKARKQIREASDYHAKVTSQLDGYKPADLKAIQDSQAIIEQPDVTTEDMAKAIQDIVSFPMLATAQQLEIAIQQVEQSDPEMAQKLRTLHAYKNMQFKGEDIKTVSDHVAKGAPTWRGLTQYEEEFTKAQLSGDASRTAILEQELDIFARSMESKAQVAEEALAMSKADGKPYTIVAAKHGKQSVLDWAIHDGVTPIPADNHSLVIEQGESDGLVYAIGNDAWRIQQYQNARQVANTLTVGTTPQPTQEQAPTEAPIEPVVDTPITMPDTLLDQGMDNREQAILQAVIDVVGEDYNPQYIQDTVDYIAGRELAGKKIAVSGISRTAHVGNTKAINILDNVMAIDSQPTAPTVTEPTAPLEQNVVTPTSEGTDIVNVPAPTQNEPVSPQIQSNEPTPSQSTTSPVETLTETPAIATIDDEQASWDNFVDPSDEVDLTVHEYMDEPSAKVPQAVPAQEVKPEPINVWAGTNSNTHLSNFSHRPFVVKGKRFSSVEKAFHYAKALFANNAVLANNIMNEGVASKIKAMTSPRALKMSPQEIERWNNNAERVMKNCMLESFRQNPKAMEQLLATGNAEITHQNGNGIEQDNGRFSRVLMEVREILRNEQDGSGISKPTDKVTPVDEATANPESSLEDKPVGVVRQRTYTVQRDIEPIVIRVTRLSSSNELDRYTVARLKEDGTYTNELYFEVLQGQSLENKLAELMGDVTLESAIVDTTPNAEQADKADSHESNEPVDHYYDEDELHDNYTDVQQIGSVASLSDVANAGAIASFVDTTRQAFKFFKQSIKQGSSNPLISVPDFVQQLFADRGLDGLSVQEYLQMYAGRDVTSADTGNVRAFHSFMYNRGVVGNKQMIAELLDNLIAQTTLDDTNLTATFLFDRDANGTVIASENVKTAIGISAFNWLVGNASKTYSSAKFLGKVLDLGKDVAFYGKSAKDYRRYYGNRNMMVNSLGAEAVKALGIRAKDEAGDLQLQQLETSLGIIAYEALHARGLVQERTVTRFNILRDISRMGKYTVTREYIKRFAGDGYSDNTSLSQVVNAFSIIQRLSPYIRYKDSTGSIKPWAKDNYYVATMASAKLDIPYDARVSKRDVESFNEAFPLVLKLMQNMSTPVTLVGNTLHRRVADNERIKNSKPIIGEQALSSSTIEALGNAQPYNDIFGRVFGVTVRDSNPLLEPQPFKQDSIRRSFGKVSKSLATMLDKIQQLPVVIKPSADVILHIGSMEDKSLLHAILGVDTASLSTAHESRIDTIHATNDAYMRDYENASMFLNSIRGDDGKYPNIFHNLVVWSNQRIGYEATSFNFQSSKLARAMSTYEQSQVNIKRVKDDSIYNKDGSLSDYGKFLHGVAVYAEGLTKSAEYTQDMKNKNTIDKGLNKYIIPALHAQLQTQVMQDAIATAHKLNTNPKYVPTDKEVRNLSEAIAKMDGGVQSFEALLELAKYYNTAIGKTFTSYLTVESDGITNGIAINQIQNGSATLHMLSQFGLIKEGETATSFHEVKDKGLIDYYETVGTASKKALEVVVGLVSSNAEVNAVIANSLAFLVPSYGNRAGGKIAGTPDNYGAGAVRLKEAAAESGIESIIKTLEKIASTQDQATLDLLNNHVHALLQFYNARLAKITTNSPLNIDQVTDLVAWNVLGANDKVNADWHNALVAMPRTNEQEKLAFINAVSGSLPFYDSMVKGAVTANNFATFSKNFVQRTNANKGYAFPLKDDKQYFTMQTVLSEQALTANRLSSALFDSIEALQGQATVDALAQVNAEFYSVRSANIIITELAYSMYETLYNTLVAHTLDMKVRKGLVRVDENGVALDYLTVKEIADIKKKLNRYLPTGDTVFSQGGKDAHNTGIVFMESGRDYVQGDRFNQTAKFTDPRNGKAERKHNLGITRTFDTKTSLRGNSSITQSIDAGTSINAIYEALEQGISAINFHDSNGFNALNVFDGATQQNKAFIDILTNYSTQAAFLQSVIRPLQGFLRVKSKAFTQNDKSIVLALVAEVINTAEVMQEAEINKAKLLASVTVVNQYGTEGGTYVRTQEELNQAKQYYQDAMNGNSKVDQVLNTLNTLVTKIQAMPVVTTRLNNIDYGSGTVTIAPTENNTIDETPHIVVDTLREISSDLQNMDASTVVDKLVAKLGNTNANGSSKLDGHYKVILRLVKGILNPAITVNLFTANQVPAHVSSTENLYTKGIQGWYDNKTKQINIVYDPAMSSEVIVHELLHAVISSYIRSLFKMKKADKNFVRPIGVSSLLYIHKTLKDMGVGTKEGTQQFANAMSNIDEFISYALTNESFMVYLSTVELKRFKAYQDDKSGKDVVGSERLITRLVRRANDAFGAVVASVASILNAGTHLVHSDAKVITALEAVLRAGVRALGETDSERANILQSSIDDDVKAIYKAQQSAQSQVSDMTMQEVVNNLKVAPTRSTEFTAQLEADVIPSLQGLFDAININPLFKDITQATDVQAYWDNAVNAQRAPYSSTIKKVGIPLDDQETFVVEALEAVLDTAMNKAYGNSIHKTVFKLYQLAKAQMNPQDFFEGDWSKATAMQKAVAEYRYNEVFGSRNTVGEDKRNHYLTRFMALAIGSQYMSTRLEKINYKAKLQFNDSDNWSARGRKFMEYVMDMITDRLAKSGSSRSIRSHMNTLVTQLKDIEYESKHSIMDSIYEGITGSVGSTFSQLAKDVRSSIHASASSDMFTQSPFAVVRTGSSLVRMVTGKNLINIPSEYLEMRNRNNPNTLLTASEEVALEFATPKGIVKKMMLLLSKNNNVQQERERLMEATKRNLTFLLEQDGIETTPENLKALTNTLLRTGLQHLLTDGLSTTDVLDLILDTQSRKSQQLALEKEIKAMHANGDVMVRRTLDMAAYSVHQKSNKALAKNSRVIASEIGVNNQRTLLRADDPLVQKINHLHAIYALNLVPKADLQRVSDMVIKVGFNSDNSIVSIIKLYQGLTDYANKVLFMDNQISMMQAYIPEIQNTHRSIEFSESVKRDKELEGSGYKYITVLGQGRSTIGTPVKMYYSPESNDQRFVDGTMSITNPSGRGTTAKVQDVYVEEALQLAEVVVDVRSGSNKAYDPMATKGAFMLPVYTVEGSISEFKYEMEGSVRDALLERDSSVIEVLSLYAGSNLDKVNSRRVNVNTADALYQDWSTNYITDPKAFTRISMNETDPRLVEIYRMIPYETREYMKELFGGSEFYVRNSVMTITFGYRKYAMTEMFDKDFNQRNVFEKSFVAVFEGVFKEKARNYVGTGQRAIMEIVAKVKDAIVIRNVSTLLANVASNFVLLSMYGVSPVAITRDTRLAITAGLQYKKDIVRLLQAKQQLAMGYGNTQDHYDTIRKVQDSIDRNPLKEFIESGMMSSIVEDVSLQTDKYSLESKFMDKYAKAINTIPKPVQTAFNWMMVSPNTPLHSFLSNSTAMSDFAAKYVLFKHNTKDGISFNDAIFESHEAFINYDVPTSKALQFMNDMGLVMFTKYFLRIQRVIMKLMGERPGSMIAHGLLLGYMLDVPTIFDAYFPMNLGNPLHPSIFMSPSIVTEPFPMSIFLK